MNKKYDSPVIVLCIILMIFGILSILMSVTPLMPVTLSSKGLRVLGLALLFIGLGEYLNHPHQEELTLSSPDDTELAKTTHRRRNPCGLGNLLDVLGLIAIFAALALFFFPHE
jgi:hypothetical protein